MGPLKACCVTENVWPAIVTVPVRDAPVFAAALTVTVPLPEPELAPLNVSQLACLVDVHAQPVPAVTLTGLVDAPAPIETDPGWIANEHAGTPTACCVTANVCPPTTITAVLAPPAFAFTVNVTLPLPDPLCPELITSHAALLAAPHVQPFPAFTDTAPFPPAAGKSCPAGEMAMEQAVAPVCVTRARMSLRTSVPSRVAAFGLAATSNFTSPLPCPVVGVTPVIHGASEDAVHAHSGCVATVTVPGPPADPIDDWLSVSPT